MYITCYSRAEQNSAHEQQFTNHSRTAVHKQHFLGPEPARGPHLARPTTRISVHEQSFTNRSRTTRSLTEFVALEQTAFNVDAIILYCILLYYYIIYTRIFVLIQLI